MPDVPPRVRLETDRLPAGPWIYGRQVERPDPAPEDGALVEVFDRSERFVGHGLYNGGSDVRLRMLARGRRSELARPREFLLRRLARCDRLRRKALRLDETGDAYRLVHGEGDELSGLVVDRLGDVLVCEHHALGFWRLRGEVEWALGELHAGFRVVHRVPAAAARQERFEPDEPPAELGELWIRENGLEFAVVPGAGHKTGWFCDQRENRALVAALCRGRHVLDLCCNAGGFALAAARAGARSVVGVDLDERVLERARRSAARNGLEVELRHADAYDVLRGILGGERRPEVVVVDPHKLIRGRAELREGLARYRDLNALALQAVAPEGLVATFSCSGALDLPGFLGVVFQAARRAGREVALLQVLGAGPDHPQRPDFPRSRYLKGALLALD